MCSSQHQSCGRKREGGTERRAEERERVRESLQLSGRLHIHVQRGLEVGVKVEGRGGKEREEREKKEGGELTL